MLQINKRDIIKHCVIPPWLLHDYPYPNSILIMPIGQYKAMRQCKLTQPVSQLCKQCKWCHLMCHLLVKFTTNASGAIWWPYEYPLGPTGLLWALRTSSGLTYYPQAKGRVQKPQARKLSVGGVPPSPRGLHGREFSEKLAEKS